MAEDNEKEEMKMRMRKMYAELQKQEKEERGGFFAGLIKKMRK